MSAMAPEGDLAEQVQQKRPVDTVARSTGLVGAIVLIITGAVIEALLLLSWSKGVAGVSGVTGVRLPKPSRPQQLRTFVKNRDDCDGRRRHSFNGCVLESFDNLFNNSLYYRYTSRQTLLFLRNRPALAIGPSGFLYGYYTDVKATYTCDQHISCGPPGTDPECYLKNSGKMTCRNPKCRYFVPETVLGTTYGPYTDRNLTFYWQDCQCRTRRTRSYSGRDGKVFHRDWNSFGEPLKVFYRIGAMAYGVMSDKRDTLCFAGVFLWHYGYGEPVKAHVELVKDMKTHCVGTPIKGEKWTVVQHLPYLDVRTIGTHAEGWSVNFAYYKEDCPTGWVTEKTWRLNYPVYVYYSSCFVSSADFVLPRFKDYHGFKDNKQEYFFYCPGATKKTEALALRRPAS